MLESKKLPVLSLSEPLTKYEESKRECFSFAYYFPVISFLGISPPIDDRISIYGASMGVGGSFMGAARE